MAEISLKIKSDFEKAAADFKKIDTTSESFQKSLKKLQDQMANGSIDKFMQKNQLAATAMTAAKGATAGLEKELSGLQSEIQRLIKSGLDPMNPALDKMKGRMSEIQGQLPKTSSSISGMSQSLSMVAGVIASSAIANKIFDIGKASLYAAGAAQENQIAFKTMLGSASMATDVLNDITQFAAKTPFNKNELIGYAKGMIGVGFATKDIIPTMNMLGNIAAGVGQEKLPNIVKAFDKMKAKGKASLEELWPIVEAGVPILDQLAKDLGKSKDQVIKMATAGTLSFDQVNKSLKKVELEKFNGLMNELTVTFGGKMSNLNDQLDMTAVIIGNKMMPAANTWLDLFGNILTTVNNTSGETETTFSNITGKLAGMGSPLKTILDYNTWIAAKANEYLFTTAEMPAKLGPVTSIYEKQLGTVKQMVDQFNKAHPPDDKKPSAVGAGKTEDQIFQDRLNKMAMSENAAYQQRLNMASSFYEQRLALEGAKTEEEVQLWSQAQVRDIENSKMTAAQKIIAIEAVNKAVKKSAENQMANYAAFGNHMLSNTGSMLTDLQTVFKNAGKESRTLAYMLKGVSAAEAAINSYVAFTRALAAFPPPFNYVAAGITLAAGLAKQAAILSTPISAETGLSNYTVPDVRGNRNDGAPVMAQGGEKVTVTPRGEDMTQATSINISIDEAVLFSVVQRGIKTGQINLNNKNVGRGVFAN